MRKITLFTKKRATENTQTTDSLAVVLTGSEQHSIFDHCHIASIDADFQIATCHRLQFTLFETENNMRALATKSKTYVYRSLQEIIHKQTGRHTNVTICNIIGDGNCLFRALSQAVTRSQDQHALFRSYIVKHMRDRDSNLSERLPENYLKNMARPGVWGTEREIASAASLLQCSIICYSKFSTHEKFCLQNFPPHFATTAVCTNTCCHPSLYIINSSGTHYDTAIVNLIQSES